MALTVVRRLSPSITSSVCADLASLQIFPFINQMLESSTSAFHRTSASCLRLILVFFAVGVDPSEVGYKAGLIESLFTFAQFCTSKFTSEIHLATGNWLLSISNFQSCNGEDYQIG